MLDPNFCYIRLIWVGVQAEYQVCLYLVTDTDAVLDTVLDLPVYKRQDTQYVYGLPALHDPIYMIDAPNEPDWPDNPHILECTWGVAYL